MLSTINAGDTAWMLFCSALVFLMVPALALFYAGLFRHSSVLLLLRLCLAILCLITLQWIFLGYTFAFGPDHNGWIGNFAWAALRNIGTDPNLEYAGSVPPMAFVMFHGMLAVLAAAFFLGAFAERIRFRALCVFVLLWTTFVYDPIAHWVWGVGGFLRYSGALDFAGGSVLHTNAAASALAVLLFLRKTTSPASLLPGSANSSWTLWGGVMLWLGWFGLAAGNALSAGALATNAVLVTQVAACAGGLGWILLEGFFSKKPTALGIVMGAMAGLVAITPAAGYVGVWSAAFIALAAVGIAYGLFVWLEKQFPYDDAFYLLSVHGGAGLWGMIATGLWASKYVNPNGPDGFFYGGYMLLAIELKTVLATMLYSFGMTYFLLKMTDTIVGLRAAEFSDNERPSET